MIVEKTKEQEILKDLFELDTNVYFFYDTQDSYVRIEYLNRIFITRTIELSFPNFKQILDNMYHDKQALFNRIELIKTLEKNLLIAKNNKESKFASLFSFENNICNIISFSDFQDENTKFSTEIKIINEMLDFKVNLNIKFLLDVLKVSKLDIIEINFHKSSSSVYIKTEAKNIVMPLALREV